MLALIFWGSAFGADLSEIKKRGVLRHLGVPYANFVTGSGDGLDVELIKRFAEHLGVKYEYVKTDWENVIGDLAGKKVQPEGNDVTILGEMPVRGDLIANGLTKMPWRQKVVDYSTATFPTQVWLVARSDSDMNPIKPFGDIDKDIVQVKALLNKRCVLGIAKTCLDPSLYGLKEAGAEVKLFSGALNELAPAVIKGEAEATILDISDALIVLEKWPGKIKVIGPVSLMQEMGVAFAKTSPELREAFNRFFEKYKADGMYQRLVKQYYPGMFMYYPAFFEKM
ncbi:MAG: transporter substrate-binding domain-containing protein [Proteobacteria bacterium]|nr:transporter substrate-binding domain-containing protein [Pseudomonadota bacterium]